MKNNLTKAFSFLLLSSAMTQAMEDRTEVGKANRLNAAQQENLAGSTASTNTFLQIEPTQRLIVLNQMKEETSKSINEWKDIYKKAQELYITNQERFKSYPTSQWQSRVQEDSQRLLAIREHLANDLMRLSNINSFLAQANDEIYTQEARLKDQAVVEEAGRQRHVEEEQGQLYNQLERILRDGLDGEKISEAAIVQFNDLLKKIDYFRSVPSGDLGNTFMHHAVKLNSPGLINALADKDARMLVGVNNDDNSPLLLAIRGGYYESALELLKFYNVQESVCQAESDAVSALCDKILGKSKSGATTDLTQDYRILKLILNLIVEKADNDLDGHFSDRDLDGDTPPELLRKLYVDSRDRVANIQKAYTNMVSELISGARSSADQELVELYREIQSLYGKLDNQIQQHQQAFELAKLQQQKSKNQYDYRYSYN